MDKRNGFTLLEIIVVVVIAGIIATFAVPGYFIAVEKGKNKEADAVVLAMANAENMYHLKFGEYQRCGNITACNSVLGLNIPASKYWRYDVFTTGGGAQTIFYAWAVRNTTWGGPLCRRLVVDCVDASCNFTVHCLSCGGGMYCE